MPEEVTAEIAGFLTRLGEEDAYAVRSSATAEDLPTASFAGQQDTYLNIFGSTAILNAIAGFIPAGLTALWAAKRRERRCGRAGPKWLGMSNSGSESHWLSELPEAAASGSNLLSLL